MQTNTWVSVQLQFAAMGLFQGGCKILCVCFCGEVMVIFKKTFIMLYIFLGGGGRGSNIFGPSESESD